MAEQKTESPAVPLPDPDRVREGVSTALERFREKRGLYLTLGVGFLLVLIGFLVWINLPKTVEDTAFGPMWQRSETIIRKLVTDESAAAELADLEAYVAGLDDTQQAGLGKWLLANFHYKEAYTTDKLDFEDKKPHLEKALSYATELGQGKYDTLLVSRDRWFADTSDDPVTRLREQIAADLEFEKANRSEQPAPSKGLTAVLRTSAGDIYLRFYRELAPKHVDNFVMLAKRGTYNGTAFHFVGGGTDDPIAIHAGDPYSFFYNDPLNRDHILRWGKGTLGYGVPPEEARFEIDHREAIVSSMRPERADWDNAAMFQILLRADPGLDRVHTPFAKVVEGLGVAKKAAGRKTAAQHQPYKDAPEFASVSTRDLVVEPVLLHKVLVFGEDGKALEHSFPLTDNEKTLGGVKERAVEPLAGDALYAGRRLRNPLTADPETIRRGLHVPFPADVDPLAADELGDRTKRTTGEAERKPDGGAGKAGDAGDAGDGNGAGNTNGTGGGDDGAGGDPADAAGGAGDAGDAGGASGPDAGSAAEDDSDASGAGNGPSDGGSTPHDG